MRESERMPYSLKVLMENVLRHDDEGCRGHGNILSKPTRAGHADHRCAWLETMHVIEGSIDNAGEFGTWDERKRILGLIKSLHLQAVDEADARSRDPDADLAGGNPGQVNLLERDIADGIVALDDDRFHVFPYRARCCFRQG